MKNNNKKIGIITFFKSINYGSVLLAWSLHHVLSDYGYSVELINYTPIRYKDIYSVLKPIRVPYDLKIDIYRLFINRTVLYQSLFFRFFRKRHLAISKKKYSTMNIGDISRQYDCAISGGDQIWNLSCTDCDLAFFLPVRSDITKIGYSVSINTTNFDLPQSREFYSWVLDYDYVSLREKNGRIKLQDYLNNQIQIGVDLDPVLLLGQNDFETIVDDKIIAFPYVFVYSVKGKLDTFCAAAIIAKRLNCQAITIFTNEGTWKATECGVTIDKKHTSPSNFLSFVKYANYVVTDSFHGLAFSLLYEKEFLCIKEKASQIDDRIENLCELFDSADRYVSLNDMTDSFQISPPLDYDTITMKRNELANISKKRLCDAIEKKKDSA